MAILPSCRCRVGCVVIVAALGFVVDCILGTAAAEHASLEWVRPGAAADSAVSTSLESAEEPAVKDYVILKNHWSYIHSSGLWG